MKFLLDLLFPKVCVECGQEGSNICDSCFEKIPIRKIQRKPRGDFFDQLIICTDYSNIKKLIIQFKYKFTKEIECIFEKLLKRELKTCTQILPGEKYVIPAPIHKANYRKRGFNQSLLLAKAVTQIIPSTTLLDCLKEKEKRKQQAHLDRRHRLRNLKDLITITLHPPLNNILLIDDIITTGSTLNECSKVLKKAGANHITAIVLARN